MRCNGIVGICVPGRPDERGPAFSFKAGKWGFAALTSADEKLQHEGKKKDVEIGAVSWVESVAWE